MEVLVVLFLAWLVWLGLRNAFSPRPSSRTSSGTLEVTFESSHRQRELSHEDAYDDSRRVWVTPGKTISLNGRRIVGGMLYVGSSLPPVAGYQETDPALIDPVHRADSKRPDRRGRHIEYWPSYSSIPRSSRAAYLDWLADGRDDPDIDVGYVFLFFYGLERRILVDADVADEARAEVPHLLEEIERLLSIYGEESRSFRRYATSLLQYGRLAYGLADESPRRTEVEAADSIDGARAAWVLGRAVAQGRPLPSAAAARWAYEVASEHLRTPARRCPDAFFRLFEVRYREKFGSGLEVEANGPMLTVSHNPASAGLRKEFTHRVDGVIDVNELSDAREPLVSLAQSVESELEDYSRWIGRRDERTSPAAAGLLPRPIVREFAGEEARSLIQRFEDKLGDSDCVVVPAEWIQEPWPTKNQGYMTGKEAEAFSGFLEGFDLGVEPDVRYSRNPSKRDYVAIFRLPADAAPPGEKFEAARLLLHLAAAVAGADDEITEEEERHIEAHLEEALDLSPSERVRLRAHLARRLQHPPTLRGVRRRAEELTDTQRRRLAKFLVTVAGADGHLDHGEVEVLEKIYDTLLLEPDAVHADLHDLAARAPGDRGPVTVLTPDAPDTGYEIPEEEPDAPVSYVDGVTLDLDRIAAVQAETRSASQELAKVFADGDEAEEQPAHFVEIGAEGLSDAHRMLLDVLVEQETLSRSEFDQLAEENGLMPGFAIEQINSAALEACGEPLLEGDDRIEMNAFALKELQR